MNGTIPGEGAFLPGTLLTTLSPQGLPVEREVETLQPGDTLLAIAGSEEVAARIRTVHRLEPAPASHPASGSIRLRAGAVAPGIPSADLLIPPEAMLRCRASGPSDAPIGPGEDAGSLIPAAALINGISITRDPADPSAHWLIPELDVHTIILANRTPVAVARPARAEPGSTPACLPILAPGPELNLWRSRILSRAREEGALPAPLPSPRPPRPALPDPTARPQPETEPPVEPADRPVHVLVAGTDLPCSAEEPQLTFHYVLPARTGPVRLRSTPRRAASAAESRRFGVCVVEIAVDDVPLPFDSPVYGPGFHPPESNPEASWRWTNGDAWLVLPYSAPSRHLRVRVTDWHLALAPA
ncbi:Hint domain-containing protein [Sphingomonas sp.]|uniref:Hint domain-containing protein n=1 Tax=Sphingomonas sp. TaxID=28214 RepID=UPI0035AF4F97